MGGHGGWGGHRYGGTQRWGDMGGWGDTDVGDMGEHEGVEGDTDMGGHT